ncbi:MAG: MerR family transcriptional regulator [Acidimicrobiia bacterium]
MQQRTVGTVAALSGLTVRALHHYDEIGLLTPSSRAGNGYRLYGDDDLDRLRTILVYRELGLGLEDIRSIIDGGTDPTEALIEERRRVTDQISRLRSIGTMLDRAILAHRTGAPMTPDEKLSVFGDFDPSQYDDETRQRWGDTDAYGQSAARTATYTEADWKEIAAEADAVYEQFLGLMANTVAADDPRAADAVDAHRAHISRWFYDCSPEIHSGLGELYTGDRRFAANLDKAGVGLTNYLSAAIAARYGSREAG